MSQVVQLWRAELARTNEKAGQSLADPADYPNLFSGLADALQAEQFLAAERRRLLPASAAADLPMNHERNTIEEMKAAEAAGSFHYVPEAAGATAEADEGDGGPAHRKADADTGVSVAAAVDPKPASAPPPAVAPVQQKPDPLLDEDDIDIDIDNLNLDDNGTENLDVTIDEDEFLTD